MARVKVSGLDSIRRKLDPSRFRDAMKDVMVETTEFGAESMRDVIDSTGTDREWKSTWYGRTGTGRSRNDTGKMRSEVKPGEIHTSQHSVSSSFGWNKGTPFYALFQNYGFTHYLTGEVIEGMNALEEGRLDATDFAIDELRNAVRDFMRGA